MLDTIPEHDLNPPPDMLDEHIVSHHKHWCVLCCWYWRKKYLLCYKNPMYYSQREWRLLGFKKSQAKGKKYAALIQHKTNNRIRTINFGAIGYSTYHDKTGLGLYDVHGDKKRRASYIARHSVFVRKGYYSSGYFSMRYLW